MYFHCLGGLPRFRRRLALHPHASISFFYRHLFLMPLFYLVFKCLVLRILIFTVFVFVHLFVSQNRSNIAFFPSISIWCSQIVSVCSSLFVVPSCSPGCFLYWDTFSHFNGSQAVPIIFVNSFVKILRTFLPLYEFIGGFMFSTPGVLFLSAFIFYSVSVICNPLRFLLRFYSIVSVVM